MKSLLCLAFLGNCLVVNVHGHGRLVEPPSRASMWRFDFDTPKDYNDNGCFCGGVTRQWNKDNEGKCGICGDPYDVKPPRDHEIGGKYVKGIIVRRYPPGAEILIRVELTANHLGFFEFRVCPVTVQGQEVSQDCLNENQLMMVNGSARYYPGPGNKAFDSYYKLPDGFQCAHCVLQWRYYAGNSWGQCENGTNALGCGQQEEFRGCADIMIAEIVPTPPRRKPTMPGWTPPGQGRPHNVFNDEEWTPESAKSPESSNFYWYFNFIIVGTCFLVVVAALALLYGYYYHAGRAKQWLIARRRVRDQGNTPPIVPPRQKRHSTTNLYL